MLRIRLFEETISEKYAEQRMRCPVHLSIGQEASAVGVCAALDCRDACFSGHRNHAHYLAKGGDMIKMVSEIYGRADGCCGGVGGSMHVSDLAAGFVAAVPIVGSIVPIAVGAALSAKLKQDKSIVCVFFGDGAMESGAIFESLWFASLKHLPILFVCEDNKYSVYSDASVRRSESSDLLAMVESHGIESFCIDGNDVEKVFNTASSAIRSIRESVGSGPKFLKLDTYRHREHCGPNFDDELGYRSKSERDFWLSRDPLAGLNTVFASGESEDIRSRINDEIFHAFRHAES